ncbi:acyl carrier protein [Streptomyces longwoodensis]|uniref:acyl carrier protein n=1 Tax=Streptomyces longwoodensis TaxID=68231 RepID=UPI0033D67838
MDNTYERLVDILTDKFEIPAAHIDPQATLGELELDSLSAVELFVTLQDHYDVELDDSYASPDTSLETLASLVGTQLAAVRADRQ